MALLGPEYLVGALATFVGIAVARIRIATGPPGIRLVTRQVLVERIGVGHI